MQDTSGKKKLTICNNIKVQETKTKSEKLKVANQLKFLKIYVEIIAFTSS